MSRRGSPRSSTARSRQVPASVRAAAVPVATRRGRAHHRRPLPKRPPSLPSRVAGRAPHLSRSAAAAKAARFVVIEQPHRLHERLDDRRADEAEPAPPEILPQRDWIAERPDVPVERPVLLLHDKARFRVIDRRADLHAIPHDALVAHEPRDVPCRVAGDLFRIEAIECLPVGGALAQDRLPRKSGLRAFEDEELEEPAVIVERRTPLLVVIGEKRLALCPAAALQAPPHSRRNAGSSETRSTTASGTASAVGKP